MNAELTCLELTVVRESTADWVSATLMNASLSVAHLVEEAFTVWAGITANERTQLAIINGALTGARYRDEIVGQHIEDF